MISTALAYGAFGWHVIPVHGMRAPGVCTCRLGANCPPKMMGKHPVHAKWQTGHLMSRADVMATWSAEAGGDPAWNIGILTGVATGGRPFFVLDVDPDNGGYETIDQLRREHGPFPHTRTHSTGSGGEHRLFLVPDGMTIRNNQRRLGPGVDIRGLGGMIVAPPSVSGKGAYGVVDEGGLSITGDWSGGLAWPPTWLVSVLTVPAGMEVLPTVVAEDLPDWSDLDPETQARASRYAANGVAGAVSDYFEAPPGRGNDQLYRSACAAIEIAQSPWNLITVDQVVRDLDVARVQRCAARPGGGQDETEFRQTVRSAHNAVVGQGRPLPPDPHGIDGLAFDVTEFLPTGDGVTTQEVPGGGLELPAERRSALERLRARLHNRTQLEEIAPPTPLIEGVIDVGNMAIIAGQFGTFKSFVTVGWACSVATGTPWLGRAVLEARPVLYVAAEGASGIRLRVDAWERSSGVRVPDHMLWVVDMATPIGDDEMAKALLTVARELEVGMVIFDTLHQVSAGLDENSSADMYRVTQMAQAFREFLGCATVYAHHTGHGGVRSRGASSLEDDADAVWIAKLTGDQSRDSSKPRQLEQRKIKDREILSPFFVKLELLEGTNSGVLMPVDEAGNPISVESLTDPFRQPRRATPQEIAEEAGRLEALKHDNAALIVNVLIDAYGESTVGEFTAEAVRALCRERYGRRPGWNADGYRNTFRRAWSRLEALGVVEATTATRFRYVPVADRQPSLNQNQTNQV